MGDKEDSGIRFDIDLTYSGRPPPNSASPAHLPPSAETAETAETALTLGDQKKPLASDSSFRIMDMSPTSTTSPSPLSTSSPSSPKSRPITRRC
jgi:hypothetical protein